MLRTVGVRRFVRDVVPWLVCRRYIFIAADVPAAPVPTVRAADIAAARISGLPFRLDRIDADEAHVLVSARPDVYTEARVRDRLRAGHLALVGRLGDTVVHLRWAFLGAVSLPYLARRLLLASDEAFLDEVYTVPSRRRRGIETAAAPATLAILRTLGVRRVIAATAAWNQVPRHVGGAYGYRVVGAGGYWNLPGCRRFFWDGAVRDHGDGNLSVDLVG